MISRHIFVLLLLFCCYGSHSQGLQKLDIWINAFIPKQIVYPGETLTYQVTGGEFQNSTAIQGPINETITGAYLTDQREFSEDRKASARMQVAVEVDLIAKIIQLKSKCDSSYRLNNFTEGEVRCREAASTENCKLLNQQFHAFPDGKQVISFTIDAKASNPCFAFGPLPAYAPSISVRIQVKIEKDPCRNIATISTSGLIDAFPAFEMYVANGENVQPVFKLLPLDGKTPFNLLGPIDRKVSTQDAPLQNVITTFPEGTWVTTDVARRFRFHIKNNMVEWTEKNPTTGLTVTRSMLLRDENGQYRVDRSNTENEILKLVGFAPALYTTIINAGPNPSYITFCVKGDQLIARWYGLSVTKHANETLNQLIQPGTKPPTEFIFKKQ